MTITKSLPFIDLKGQQERIRADIDRRIARVLDHGQYIMGPEIRELETLLAEFAGVKHCISCASGTDALLMPLMAYGVGPGDIVLTPAFTFIATAEVVSLLGAEPVFVDIEPDTFNMDPNALRAVLNSDRVKNGRVRGIIPVDLFGQLANYEEIEKIAREFDLFVIEDAAQSFGAAYRGRRAGSFGNVAATSFFPAKPLGAYGDGGAIFTDDDDLADKMRSIRVHGKGTHKYDNVRIGINGRCDCIQAAVLLAKMEVFPAELEARGRIAQRYTNGLPEGMVAPVLGDGHTSAWAQYTLQVDNRDEMIAQLKEHGIPTAIYYPKPLHLQDAFADLGGKLGDLPITERLAGTVFSLPMHPYLAEEDQDYILETLNKCQAGA